jgi:regulator of nucleoside diphosphate kinase
MPIENEIRLSEADYEKLLRLVDISRSEATAALKKKILKAGVYPEAQMPTNIASLYSKLHFREVLTGRKRVVTIVMPWEANVTRMRISILSPVGILLIGALEGVVIEWPLLNNCFTKLEIVGVCRAAKELLYA